MAGRAPNFHPARCPAGAGDSFGFRISDFGFRICRLGLALLLAIAPALGAEQAALLAGRPEPPGNGLPPNLDPVQAGWELAAQLRSMIPAENSRYSGTLKTRQPEAKITTVPVMVATTVNDPSWQVVYETAGSGSLPPERLTIIHAPDQPVAYLYATGTNLGQPARLAGDQANRPFAGSVFWLSDLGLEFFHWPEQRLTKIEMRQSRSCRVLESRRPRPPAGGYLRVLSWIDVETSGLICAEAYDAQNKLLKEFTVKGIQEVQGKWQLKDIRIRNVQTKTTTNLEYDPNKSGP